MREIDWNLRPGEVYYLTLRAEQELFAISSYSAMRYIVGSAIGSALARYPVTLHAATVRSADVELRFSVTKQQIFNVRPFLEHLVNAAEETVVQVYPDAPKRLFCSIEIVPRPRNGSLQKDRVYPETSPEYPDP